MFLRKCILGALGYVCAFRSATPSGAVVEGDEPAGVQGHQQHPGTLQQGEPADRETTRPWRSTRYVHVFREQQQLQHPRRRFCQGRDAL